MRAFHSAGINTYFLPAQLREIFILLYLNKGSKILRWQITLTYNISAIHHLKTFFSVLSPGLKGEKKSMHCYC